MMGLKEAEDEAAARRRASPFAFPTAFTGEHEGMRLRDWFAGQALSALAEGAGEAMVEGRAHDAIPLIAGLSYRLADAMLQERERK